MRNLPTRGVSISILLLAGMASVSHAEDAGSHAFERCAACHTVKSGEASTGPTLYHLMGRRAGSAEGFRYSGPLKRGDIIWDQANLAKFLRDPQAVIPGNRMPFSGVTDEAELSALIGYLNVATK